MNILVVTNMYPSSEDESWRGVFVKDQIDTLCELYPEVSCDILHIKGNISNGGSSFNYLIGLWRYLTLGVSNKYDFVWAHHSFCVFLAVVNRKIPIVYTVHEGVLRKGFKFALINKALSFSDYVIFVNKYFFSASKHAKKNFLPSGVDTSKFICLPMKKCRSRLGLDVDKYYILFPASPARPEKNSAFACAFIEKYASWLASENIEFIFGGSINYELMPTWMNAVDCLVSFSEFESDGMVFKEAMACNLPVITFNVGNAHIYFKNEVAGSIIEGNHAALKEKISFWRKKGRSHGRDYLLTLGMDNNYIAHKLKKIFDEVGDGRN